MKYDLVSPKKLIIGKSDIKGRGVFANEDIEKNEIVEECHFIFPEKNKGGEAAQAVISLLNKIK